ncbi:ATP-dependent zinc metalloprotease FtsH [uncultured Oscillibacter sp.]|uniref:ATP-dependent zinc metalloprotease FtsH n=1 Tax=uncultured Oscillibacter sp. TaxID=876091 RepID=UPI002805DBAE|nr:ATP-dependent zinc metalloprotease FtsH [uncultured Oscillibacter sp.]
MTKQNRASSFSVFFLVLVIVMCASFLWRMDNQSSQLTYSQVRQLFEQEKVTALEIDSSNTLTMTLRDQEGSGGKAQYRLQSFWLFYFDLNDLVQEQVAKGVITSYDYPEPASTNWLELLLPWVLTALLLGVMWYFMFARGQGGAGVDRMAKFGAARTRTLTEKDKKVTFEDVAGADEEKEELREIVEFLRDPQKYISLGARVPKGVLLVGPPGTGKTLLGKAVAGEAGVGFLSISGSDFVELYVGVGASRVRDLFDQAKKTAPAIIFIDEIDAVGRQRGTGLGGGHDEREQTLNQLLVEMDGFAANEGVVVLAATNRSDVLDPALLRPGRFDRQIYVGLPDIRGREEILKVHAKGKPLAEDVDLRHLAQGTPGFTGADLENLINEGALLAARKGQKFVTMADLKEAEIKVIAGPEKKSRVIPQHERELTAWHEAGHAVVMHALPEHDPVTQITIVPRGQAGGMTISLPEEDRSYLSKRYMENQIVALLGGRVAEQLCLGDISTGASNDIQRATQIARKMVASYGMSDRFGAVSFESGHDEVFIGRTMSQGRSYSEAVAAQIDEEVRRLVNEAYTQCETILKRLRPQLDAVAAYLLEHETMEREAFLAVFGETDTAAT